ncbi:hypothetical protein [Marinobacter sp.]|uniref:hypothetical protein n=1 Tax=Marinobacter sp. TaxID=50741 RepID=UPI003569D480
MSNHTRYSRFVPIQLLAISMTFRYNRAIQGKIAKGMSSRIIYADIEAPFPGSSGAGS